MCQDMRVLADKNNFILQHNKGQEVNKCLEGEHTQNRENPLTDKESFRIIPIGKEGNLLLINQLMLVLFIEADFLVL